MVLDHVPWPRPDILHCAHGGAKRDRLQTLRVLQFLQWD
jgi:hypothetical protein